MIGWVWKVSTLIGTLHIEIAAYMVESMRKARNGGKAADAGRGLRYVGCQRPDRCRTGRDALFRGAAYWRLWRRAGAGEKTRGRQST